MFCRVPWTFTYEEILGGPPQRVAVDHELAALLDCRPDLVAVDNNIPPKKYLGKFYFDSLVHDAGMLHYLVKLVGANCVALGSDYPFPLGEDVPGSLIEKMDFDYATKERLLNGTALEWLGLPKEKFLSLNKTIHG